MNWFSLAYSVSDSYEPGCSWSHKVNINTSYTVSEYYYLAFVATYLPIDSPKSFQRHAAECLFIDSSSSQPTNIAVAMETQPTQWSVAVILGLNNWTEWIRSIQHRAETPGVWSYINLAKTKELRNLSYLEPKDVKPMATRYSDLSEDEKEELKE